MRSLILVACTALCAFMLPACAAEIAHGSGADPIAAQPPAGACHIRGNGRFSLPDRHCTPGATDPAVSQANIRETICRRGYAASVRPPETVTRPEKLASMAAYGDAGSPRLYEYDHLVPLELGGARNDPRNLWPQPGASPNVKDELEGRMRSLVCSGALRLALAQRLIAVDWVSAWMRLIGQHVAGHGT